VLTSKPHLYGLALSNVEETQIESDYANVMHKCNVPTPIFIGRNVNEGAQTTQMGQGIDIPVGGSAMFLEPGGSAIAATVSAPCTPSPRDHKRSLDSGWYGLPP